MPGIEQYLTPGKDLSHASGLDPEFARQLMQMFGEAPGQISIYSGYRDKAHQARLYADALKKYGSPEIARKHVAPPGRSSHNFGLASDLKYGSKELEQWAHDNASKYGLQFRMSHEGWHIEPIDARQRINAGYKPGTAQQMPAPVPGDMPGGQQNMPGAQPAGSMLPPMLTGADPMSQPQPLGDMSGDLNTNQMMADMINGISPLRRVILGKVGAMLGFM